jgi:hypothetical protein
MSRSLYEVFGTPAGGPRPGPGTYETKTVETVDNDQAMVLSEVLAVTHLNELGTRRTEAIETLDDDMVFHHLTVQVGPPTTTLTATIESADEEALSSLCMTQ